MTVDPARHFLEADLALERERVAQEQAERQAAVDRLRRKVAPTLGLQLPDGTIPPDQTPRPLGLDTAESYALKRWSPVRSRWPEVHEYDDRVRQLEGKQAGINTELQALQDQVRQAEIADRDALSLWAVDHRGPRPLPTLPGIEQRIGELGAERDALTLAMQRTLDEKVAYVEKQRARLIREAQKARKRALERLREEITHVEEARTEAADCVAAERWAADYPEESANASDLRLQLMKGGRLTRALPDFKGLAVAEQAIEWLRDDAAWLDIALERDQDDELDIRKQAVWESTPEGNEALNKEKQRIRAALVPRNVREAGWESDERDI
jgi:hypothetical protein